MSRALLHLGFHKTGTSTAQAFLHANREIVWRAAALALPGRVRAVSRQVRWYHDSRDPAVLGFVEAEMRGFLDSLKLGPKRALIVSAENLLGPMPRGQEAAPYPVALPVIRALCAALAGAGRRVTLYLSTRAQPEWEASLWAHHARRVEGPRLTDDLETFRARIGRVPLTAQIDEIRAGFPGVDLRVHDIADLGRAPLGMGQPFADFLRPAFAGTPPDWQAVAPQNAAPARAVTDQMIALNRGDLDDTALAAAKRALLDPAETETRHG